MSSISRFSLGLAAVVAFVVSASAQAADPIAGQWVTEERDAVVTIGDCGRSTCGRISRFLKAPPGGRDQRDVNNPKENLRDRKLLGLPILTGFSEDGDEWRGTIYDPKSGRSYRSVLRRLSAGRLEVKGCLGPFCQTQEWTRASNN